MGKLYENFHIVHFKKRIVSAETIRRIQYPHSTVVQGTVLDFFFFVKTISVSTGRRYVTAKSVGG